MEKNTIKKTAALIRSGQVSVKEILDESLLKIKRNAVDSGFVICDERGALESADAAEKRITLGEMCELLGICYSVSDNILTEGLAACAGSRMLSGFVPSYSATVHSRLAQKGAVMVGKTCVSEFSVRGDSPDGEKLSHGSARSVALGEVLFSLCTDTGGEALLSALRYSIVGVKPTSNRVSRHGVVSHSPRFDSVSIIANTVSDAALVFSAVSGKDGYDVTVKDEAEMPIELGCDVSSLKIAVIDEMLHGVSDECRSRFENVCDNIIGRGARIDHVSVQSIRYAPHVWKAISSAESSSILARYDGVRGGYKADGDFSNITEFYQKTRGEGFGSDIKKKILLGTYLLGEDGRDILLRSEKIYSDISSDVDALFSDYDFIISAVSAHMTHDNALSALPNICGLCAVVLPSADRSFSGVELMGKGSCDHALLSFAHTVNRVMGGEDDI